MINIDIIGPIEVSRTEFESSFDLIDLTGLRLEKSNFKKKFQSFLLTYVRIYMFVYINLLKQVIKICINIRMFKEKK